LVRLPVARVHLQTIDTLISNRIQDIERYGLAIEQIMNDGAPQIIDPDAEPSIEDDLISKIPREYDPSFRPDKWEEFTFTIHLSDGYTRVPVVPGGENIPLTIGNWREYICLLEECRLRESSAAFRAFKDGLSVVLPVELLPLFTAAELELMISGSRSVDIKLLQQCTEYDNLKPDSDLVRNFWSVLESMDDEDRTLFLRFVWARSRMPASAQDLPMNFKLQAAAAPSKGKADDYLPHAQTCFFSLSLPSYSSRDVLREKLLYAISNSPNMDADVRLHNAEGWADS
jgi:hypothetical protein